MKPGTVHILWFLFTLNIVTSNRTYSPLTKGRSDDLSATQVPRVHISWTPGRESHRIILDGEEVVFRVVNGRDARLGDVPYQVSFRKHIKRRNAYASFCGGTLVHERKAITAAHCFHHSGACESCCHSGRANKKTLEDLYAVVGCTRTFTYHVPDSLTEGQWRLIKEVIYPKSYHFPRHDVAVAFFVSPFELNANVQLIAYARKSMDYSGSCLLSGYGRISDNRMSDRLRLADLRVLPKKACSRLHRTDMHRFICTSDEVSDIGKGDSGGPLVCQGTGDKADNGSGVLVGIVSGKRVSIRHGSFFVRVSEYKDFIRKTMAAGTSRKEIFNFIISTSLLFTVLYTYLVGKVTEG